MRDWDDGYERMLVGLLNVIGTTSLDDLPDTVSEHAPDAGFTEVRIYLGDLERRALHLLAGARTPESAERVCDPGHRRGPRLPARQGSARARALIRRHTGCRSSTEGARRGDVVVGHRTRGGHRPRDATGLATLLALAVSNKPGHSDTYARLNRTQAMNVAAEAQWHLMPPRTYTDARVAICATLEPSYQINGDAYDYAIAGPLVYLSIFDAMGHDTAAGQTAALAVAASRSARRRGAGIAETGSHRGTSSPASSTRSATPPRSSPPWTPTPGS